MSSRPVHGHGRKRSLLLVDQPCSARVQVERFLGAHSCDVYTAETTETAWAMARSYRPAAAIIELRLKGSGSGMTLLELLRRELPEIRAVVLTSYASVATAVRATRLGAVAYLAKPVAPSQLLTVLDGTAPPEDPPVDVDGLQRMTLDRVIWEHIHQTLEAVGTISGAARALGLHRQSLKRKMAKYCPG